MGVELIGKIFGVIGVGNIGGIVCDCVFGLKMKVIVFDLFLLEEKVDKMGVEKVELDDLLVCVDFIMLYVLLIDGICNILLVENFVKIKKGVCIINCVCGGLVDEVVLVDLLKLGYVVGVVFDVFSEEFVKENLLFNLLNVVCIFYLGVVIIEVQENVVLQVVEQILDYLLIGVVINVLNMLFVIVEEVKVMGLWLKLVGYFGNFIGQMVDELIKVINILYDGVVLEMNLCVLECGVVVGIMKKVNFDVNMVLVFVIVKECGVKILVMI